MKTSKLGRPTRCDGVSRPITIRVSPAERGRWQALATLAGQTLSAWLRAACDARLKGG
jgi:hypothetical protein